MYVPSCVKACRLAFVRPSRVETCVLDIGAV